MFFLDSEGKTEKKGSGGPSIAASFPLPLARQEGGKKRAGEEERKKRRKRPDSHSLHGA